MCTCEIHVVRNSTVLLTLKASRLDSGLRGLGLRPIVFLGRTLHPHCATLQLEVFNGYQQSVREV